ncbi:Glycosyl hydrolase family protein [Forsythia ovata]|uniref:beta-glucosidase n=1 Tax=Forsythia ovata TaxID=205694 RepID=A0ABD1T447_9LAMI
MLMTVLVLFFFSTAAAEAEYLKYKDLEQPLKDRIKDLLRRMTPEEKIGQMTQIDIKVASPEIMEKYFIGSILVGGGNELPPKASAETWINMVNEFQRGALSTRLGIPIIIGTDAVHGQKQCLRTNVAACAKHFVGDGGTMNGIDENNTVIDLDGLLRIHMPAYLDAISKGVATVMISYSSWNGKKMHANYDLITGYLKKELKFKGFVISDSEGIDKITYPPHANYTYSVQEGIHAGIDMVMVPEKFIEFINVLTFLVKEKFIPISRINDAVERILRVKFLLGLFENPMADLNLVNQLGSQEHRELAREAKAQKILVAGSHANNIGYQCGGWTIEWPGLSGNSTIGTTILTAVKNTVDPLTEVIYNENPDREFLKSKHFSYAVVVVGELAYSETVGGNMNLTIAEPGYDTITNVCEVVKCVVLIISGRPVVIEPYLENLDALVAAWLPGTEGQGIADVLFGDYGFTGKLARTWFRTVDQLPMNVGDQDYDPLFPFGYGLTTTPTEPLAAQ